MAISAFLLDLLVLAADLHPKLFRRQHLSLVSILDLLVDLICRYSAIRSKLLRSYGIIRDGVPGGYRLLPCLPKPALRGFRSFIFPTYNPPLRGILATCLPFLSLMMAHTSLKVVSYP